MKDSERYHATLLFIAALKSVLNERNLVRFDPKGFAQVVSELSTKGNAFAQKFPLYQTSSGLACPDFHDGMTIAQAAGLISRQNPTYEYFSIRISPRLAKETLQQNGSLAKFAKELASKYSGAKNEVAA